MQHKRDITLLGRSYAVACNEGEEDRLAALAALVEIKLRQAAAGAPSASEARIFMLGCLLLADEVIDLKSENSNLREAQAALPKAGEQEDLFVAAVDLLTERIGALAGRLASA